MVHIAPKKIVSHSLFKAETKKVYYPGAGWDFETMQHLMDNSDVEEIYLVDYSTGFELHGIKDELRRVLGDLINIEFIRDLSANDFGVSDMRDLWHPECYFIDRAEMSVIKEFKVYKGARSLKLFYFSTEAIKTYEVLVRKGIRFDILVCQDISLSHWASFGNKSLLYEVCKRYKSFPKFMFVCEKFEVWDGYSVISDYFGRFGIYQESRAFFRLKS